MTSLFAIRPYRASDRAAVAQVFFRAVREGSASRYDAAQRSAWAPSPEPDLTRPDKLLDQWCFVAEADGRITGFMSLCPDGLLDMAFVLPEVMGKGTAGALYDALLAKAKAEALPRLTVEASHFSQSFLQKRGWQVTWQGARLHDGLAYSSATLVLDLPAI